MPGLFDRIKDTWVASTPTTLSALATFVVSGVAPTGYQTFSARYVSTPTPDSNIAVAVISQTTGNWQISWCTYTAANTLRVDTIIASSNNDNAVTFPVGTSDVFVTPSAKALAGIREINTFTASNTFSANVGMGVAAAANRMTVKSTASNINNTHWLAQDNGDLAALFADGSDNAWLRLWDGAGTEQFRLRAGGDTFLNATSGNVGVGTTTPTSALHVSGTNVIVTSRATSGYGAFYAQGATGNSAYYFFGINGTESARIQSDASNVIIFANGSSPTERMRIDNSGNVGIGSTAPEARLHVRSDAAAESAIFIQNNNAGGYAALRIGNSDRGTNGDHLLYGSGLLGIRSKTGTPITFEPTGTERVRITTAGDIGIGISAPTLNSTGTFIHIHNSTAARAAALHLTNAESGSGATNGLIVGKWSDSASYFFDYSANPLIFGTSSLERMRLDASGNLGIGTTSFSSRLHVEAGSQANATDAAYFAKTRQSTNAVRYTFTDIGGVDGDGNGGSFWRGLHLASPAITVSGSGVFPRLSIFSNVNSLTDPVTRYWGLYAGNDAAARYSIALFTGDNIRLWINGSDGNVGLRGITSPAHQLTLNAGATNETQVSGYSGATFIWGLGRESNSLNLDAFDAVTFRTGSSTGPRTGSQKASIGTARMDLSALFPLRLQTGSVTMDCTPTAGATDSFVWNTSANAHYIWTMAGSERMRLGSTGGLSVSTSDDGGPGTIRIGRQNASGTEGGQLEFCRSSDNTLNMSIDLVTISSVDQLRFIDIPNGVSRLALTRSGDLMFEGTHPGPTSTTSVGYMGAPVNNQTTTYTLVLTDAGKTVRKTGTTAFTVTIPADGTTNFPIGTCIILCNAEPSAGALNVTGATGVTMYTYTSSRQARAAGVLSPIAFGGSATIRKIAANSWAMSGAGVS